MLTITDRGRKDGIFDCNVFEQEDLDDFADEEAIKQHPRNSGVVLLDMPELQQSSKFWGISLRHELLSEIQTLRERDLEYRAQYHLLR